MNREKQITVTISQDEFEKIINIVHKRENSTKRIVSVSQIIREFVTAGLEKEVK